MRWLSLLSLLGLLAGFVLAPLTVAAQPAGTATPQPAAPETLFSAVLSPLGSGAHVAVFSRAMIDPGKTLALGATAGPALAFVASGSATVTAQTAGARVSSSASSAAVAPGASAPLDAGALLLLDTGASVNLANGGSAPVQLLNAVFLPAPGAASATPASAKPAFTDPLPLPSSAIQIVVSRLDLAAGTATGAQSANGPQLVAVQNGAAVVELNPGRLRVMRADGTLEFISGEEINPATLPTLDANDSEDREAIEAQGGSTIQTLHGAQVGLGAGDAGLLEAGATWMAQNPAGSPAEAIVITLAPAPAATPAS